MPLQEERKKAKMTQKQLAEAAGINQRMLEYYETGIKDINGAKLCTLLKLCEALGCGLRNLITDDETMKLLEKLNY